MVLGLFLLLLILSCCRCLPPPPLFCMLAEADPQQAMAYAFKNVDDIKAVLRPYARHLFLLRHGTTIHNSFTSFAFPKRFDTP
jgi:hypothetical protein